MAKIKTSYTDKFKNEYHRLPNSKPKRERNQKNEDEDNKSLIFEFNEFHFISVLLTWLAPLSLGWTLGIASCILLSALTLKEV